jgi:hypothetical protein
MENTKAELAQIELTLEHAKLDQIAELRELQLALIGGGGGDVVFA